MMTNFKGKKKEREGKKEEKEEREKRESFYFKHLYFHSRNLPKWSFSLQLVMYRTNGW